MALTERQVETLKHEILKYAISVWNSDLKLHPHHKVYLVYKDSAYQYENKGIELKYLDYIAGLEYGLFNYLLENKRTFSEADRNIIMYTFLSIEPRIITLECGRNKLSPRHHTVLDILLIGYVEGYLFNRQGNIPLFCELNPSMRLCLALLKSKRIDNEIFAQNLLEISHTYTKSDFRSVKFIGRVLLNEIEEKFTWYRIALKD